MFTAGLWVSGERCRGRREVQGTGIIDISTQQGYFMRLEYTMEIGGKL